jgi:cbb3-type cytochrome oxidase maturation protein
MLTMESLYLLIPVALVFCAIAIKLLLWAIDSGQYDDLDKESWRILNDDDGWRDNRGRAHRLLDASARTGEAANHPSTQRGKTVREAPFGMRP